MMPAPSYVAYRLTNIEITLTTDKMLTTKFMQLLRQDRHGSRTWPDSANMEIFCHAAASSTTNHDPANTRGQGNATTAI
jgi:hypothetical protein